MNIVQQILKGFQRMLEVSLELLEKGINFQEFEEKLWEIMHSTGKDILKAVPKTRDQEIYQEKARREGFKVIRRNDPRTILTLFGDLHYRRTYYQHQNTREYQHLLPEELGFRKRRRIDPLLEALILEKTTVLSYHRAGSDILPENQEVTVSPEVVKRLVHNLSKETEAELPETRPKTLKKLPYLFIEADEDHVPFQEKRNQRNKEKQKKKSKKKRLLAKLVYVHEGRVTSPSGRVKLKNPHYFAGLYEDSEALFLEVLDYLEENYDLDSVQCIFLGGDGGSWIKQGLNILPKAVFVLDRFHLAKRIKEALHHNPQIEKKLWKAIQGGFWDEVADVLLHGYSETTDPKKKESIKELYQYLQQNFQGILALKHYEQLKPRVSAEGHVSHILSARLSQRPMAWGKKGADHMSYLRAMKFNQQSVRSFYLRTHKQKLPAFTLSSKTIQREKERGKEVLREVYGNIPVMRKAVSSLRLTLKALSQEISWVSVI
jgi:hypothetical protein